MNGRFMPILAAIALLPPCVAAELAEEAVPPAPEALALAASMQQTPSSHELLALDKERDEAIAAFDWGGRTEFGARLLAYNQLMSHFDLRELTLRADWHEAQGRPQEAARLRAEREAKLAAVPPQPQAVPHTAPGAAEEVTR